MQDATCFRCGKPLNPLEPSEEHVLPQALGGRLKSKTLLCGICNSHWGEHPDGDILRFFGPLCTFLDVKRERGDAPKVQGEYADGTKIKLDSDGKPELHAPTFDSMEVNGAFHYNIIARFDGELRKMLEGLKRKHPLLDIDDVMAKAKRVSEYAEGPARFQCTIEIDDVFREALKIALGFLVLCFGDRSLARKLAPLVDPPGDIGSVVCWTREMTPFPKLSNRVLHSVVLVGSKAEKLLYAQTSLFGVLTCTIVLDDNYTNEDFMEWHVENPLTGCALETITAPRRLDKVAIAALRAKGRATPLDVMPRMQAIANLGQTRMEIGAIGEHYLAGLMSVLTKPEHQGVLITEELMAEAQREANQRVNAWAQARQRKND